MKKKKERKRKTSNDQPHAPLNTYVAFIYDKVSITIRR